MFDYDLIVIGVGPAGEKAAAQAAYFGKRVCAIERAPEPGGAGTHTGTVPSKTLRETAMYLSGYHSREMYGVAVELERTATVPRLMSRKSAIVASESKRIRDNLQRHGVSYMRGVACFVDAHTVEVADDTGARRVTGDRIIIATGSRPARPAGIDFFDEHVHDSDEILRIERLPASLTILGAGVIGCEYACMFAALGVKVTLVDARDSLLAFLDGEVVEQLVLAMRRLGIDLRLGLRWSSVQREDAGMAVSFHDGTRIVSGELLYAAGREGRVEELNLGAVGIVPDKRGYLHVNERFQTSVPNILAAGDAIGFPALAATSMEQGRVAICHAFGFDYKKTVGDLLPYGIYTIPEVSALGETEESCQHIGIAYAVGRARYAENARGKIAGDTEGFLKLIVARDSRKLIGVHVVGERATELVHIGQAIVHLGGTVDVLIEMVFNFPSLAEAYKYAAYDCLGRLAKPG
ncbi:MAG: Si-specific NAD(P)(+) transhydrogenase [Burkholderiales bacterium]|nr:Si-specific NAD(P)(+) transhydrogenase [Burkholderiales bacterium]